MHYAPHGAPAEVKFGNNLLETTMYNNRLQVQTIAAGSLLTLTNDYGATSNNGNLQSQAIFDGAATRIQNFTYDMVDRLLTAAEGSAWTQNYVYDIFGNRALLSTSSDPAAGLDTLLTIKTTTQSTVPFSASTNRWIPLAGGHDQAGNLTDVQMNPDTFHADYDAENRLIGTTSVLASTTKAMSYAYDGEGRRVQKADGTAVTTYVYDATGQLAAEYGANATAGTTYLTSDHLGSTRLVTKAVTVNGAVTPAVVGRSDYLPFGQEIPTSWGGRTNYAPDASQKIKFTGQERDAETGLDFFGARYYSGAQGRFTSPDAPFADQHLEDPQSWNLYAYARNNPLRYVDKTGRAVCSYGSGAVPEGGAATTEKDCTEGGGTWVYQPTDTDDPNADAPYFWFSTEVRENSGQLSATGQAVVNQLAENANSSMALIATVAGGSAAVGAVAGLLPALAPETLYHFTTQVAKEAIIKAGQIIPAVGITGLGVYGTAIRNGATVAWAGVSTQAVVPFSVGLSQVRPGLIPFLWWSVRPTVTTLFQYGVPIR